MTGRIRQIDGHERTALEQGWQMQRAPTQAEPDLQAIAQTTSGWQPARVPGTVASALREAGCWNLDERPRDFDSEEWWYRLRFSAPPTAAGERIILAFEGLATLAEAWLNGRHLFESSNMFVAHECDVGDVLDRHNELLLRFRPLAAELERRRPRPRWRTPMVAQQQLRWFRTSLLGRTPGWSPPAAAVGPWLPVWLERRRRVEVSDLRLRATLRDGQGTLTLSCAVSPASGMLLGAASLQLERHSHRFSADLLLRDQPPGCDGRLDLPQVALWWPHTHGDPALYRASLRVTLRDEKSGAAEVVDVDLGNVGFRELRLERAGGDFSLSVNGQDVFCRGACWMPLDCISLQASNGEYRDALETVRAAGMNMLRVAGPTVYENDEFLDLCDSMGILLWQDFMFANMDYPLADAPFREGVEIEVRAQLCRLQARPALAVLCGNSEGGQQAAMSGAPRECWTPAWFEIDLAALAAEYCPGVPYTPSSTQGGAFPHQSNQGAASYYGVGAYRLPLTDARRAEVRFASECLAFANVPENESLALLAAGRTLRCHHPRWKERVPRDQGAGWDFDDVRDHYLQHLFRLDAVDLRYAEYERYLEFSRAVSGEVMAACFAEWRRAGSTCGGALVWFLRDLWLGAGWGVIDSTGLPKAAYYHLKRALQPLALFIADEGVNGLVLHVVNERPQPMAARLELSLYRHSVAVGSVVAREMLLDAASRVALPAADFYDGFADLSYTYRFGPASYAVMHARLLGAADGAPLADAFYFPLGLPNGLDTDVGLSAQARAIGDGGFTLQIQCRNFAQSVHLDIPGFVADDQYFHMAPRSARTLRVRPRVRDAASALAGSVHALNSPSIARIAVVP
ncbi:MAG: glycoside hydrolase family 2 protein [Gammaproteobacteria bacterium]